MPLGVSPINKYFVGEIKAAKEMDRRHKAAVKLLCLMLVKIESRGQFLKEK